MSPEEIVEGYMRGKAWSPSKDLELRAAIGKLTADRSKELSEAIKGLHNQIPLTISELRQIIDRNTDKMIKSNERLSISNERYAKGMQWLTGALVIVGIIQIIISYLK